jgi:transcriptional regulator GlxA family with amidase domain
VHRVAILAYDGVVPFDLSVPIEVFRRARLPGGRPAYEVQVCAGAGEVAAGLIAIRTPYGLDGAVAADTVVVPGTDDIDRPIPAVITDTIAAAYGRLVSICTGAFTLAAAGVLDGRRATTHWAAAGELARRHPSITVEPDVLFVDDGRVLTSAGAAAGLDLCLHVVRRDHGATVAAQTARASVMPLERSGGQAQFITHEPPAPAGTSLLPLLTWLADNLHSHLSLADIAERASMSTRSLSRHFRHQTGTTPQQWLSRQRIRRAQQLLEQTGRSVEQVGELVGFTSPTAFRECFRHIVGASPRDYRRAFPPR